MSINVNDLTVSEAINQAKELAALFGGQAKEVSNLYAGDVGKYVICRSQNEGVNAGKVLAADETGVILEDARRLYYHKPADTKLSWYEGVALTGLSSDSKVGPAVRKTIAERYSLTICTSEAEKSIREAKCNEQS